MDQTWSAILSEFVNLLDKLVGSEIVCDMAKLNNRCMQDLAVDVPVSIKEFYVTLARRMKHFQ